MDSLMESTGPLYLYFGGACRRLIRLAEPALPVVAGANLPDSCATPVFQAEVWTTIPLPYDRPGSAQLPGPPGRKV